MDIGRPKRIHEIRPDAAPVPDPAWPVQPTAPEPQPQPAKPSPAPARSGD